MKKNILTVFALVSLGVIVNAQNYTGKVGINTETPAATLQVKELTTVDNTIAEGIIAPNIPGDNLKNKNAATYDNAQTGALVYVTSAVSGIPAGETINVTSPGYYYFDGLVWQKIGSTSASGNFWGLTGNSGTTAGTNFLGTTDSQDLMFKVNNTAAGYISKSTVTTSTNDFLTTFGYNAGAQIVANTISGTGNLDDNTFIGSLAAATATGGARNTIVGARAMGFASNTGTNNTALGAYALGSNTGGGNNTANGANALFANTSGSNNIAIGDSVLGANQIGNYNTAVGRNALSSSTGDSNTAFGGQAGSGITTGSNNIVIGRNAQVASGTANDQLSIGNLIFGTGLNGTVAAPAGNIGIGVIAPSNKLHVVTTADPVRFEGLQITTATNDAIITTDTNGVLKKSVLGSGLVLNSAGVLSTDGDWKLTGNTDSEVSTISEILGNAVASTNYLGTQGGTDNLVIATAGKTRGVLDTNGTLIGGGNVNSSLSWGIGNSLSASTNSIALGRDNAATGDYSLAIGRNNSATSTSAIAIGGQAITGAAGTTIIQNSNSGTYSSSIGFGNTVTGNKNQVLGIRNIVSAANTAINFLGGTNVIGNDNEINSRNSVIIGNTNKTDVAASGTPNSVIVVGNSNGNSSKLGGFILGSSNNTSTGYVFGAGNTNTTTSTSVSNTMVIGFDFNNTTMAERTSSYANNQHYFAPSNATKTNVGINTNPNTLTATQLESDLTVNTQIRILPQTAATTCNSTTLGAIRFNSGTSKHEGCGNGAAGNPGWQPLY